MICAIYMVNSMSLKRKIKKLLERLTNTHIYSYPVVPRGIDYIQDIANSLPRYSTNIIFDVGANVGQSANNYLSQFPDSRIYCFEPVFDTFQQLEKNLNGNPRVECYQLALGSAAAKGKMVLQDGQGSTMSFLLGQSKVSPTKNDVMAEVDVVTLDQFCDSKGVTQINYLKIDTEGGDLEVLQGSVKMLAEQKIDLIEVEAGMNPNNTRHVPFEVLKSFLESHNYFVFGIYEQIYEWPTKEPHLRRINPIFISQRSVEVNRRSI